MQADFSVELGHDDPMLELPWTSNDRTVRYYDLKKFPEMVRQIPEAAAHPELSVFLTRINALDSPLETAKCDLWQSNEISPEEEIFGVSQKFVSYIDLLFNHESIRGSFEKHEQFAAELCRLLSRAPDIAATIELIIRRCYYRPHDAESSQDDVKSIQTVAQPRQQIGERQIAKDQVGQKEEPMSEAQQINTGSRIAEPGQGEDDRQLKEAGQGRENAANRHSGETEQYMAVEQPVGSRTAAGMSAEKNPVADVDYIADFSTGFYFTAYVSGFGDDQRASQQQWSIAISLFQHALVQLSSQSLD